MAEKRPRILAVSSALNPHVGSEAGAAWGVVKLLSRRADVDVLVPNREFPGSEAWREKEVAEGIRVITVDRSPLSALLLGLFPIVPKVDFLSYWIWLSAARRVGLELEKTNDYAAAVHVAYGSYWLPSPVVDFKAPSIWGPVGGATRTPLSIWRYLRWRGYIGESFKYAMVRLVSRLPSVRRTWRKADFPLAETENTRQALPRDVRSRTRIINRAALQEVPPRIDRPRQPYILFPSHLQPRKAPALAVRALLHADPRVTLKFVADGMEQEPIERLARRLGVADRVEFHGKIPRDEMFRMVTECSAAVFLGTREEGGCALAEAMQMGTPVIVLGVGGAKLLAETNTDPSRVRIVEPAGKGQPEREVGEAMSYYVNNPHPRTDGFLDRDSMEQKFLQVLDDAIALHAARRQATVARPAPAATPVTAVGATT